ncbi:seipin SKDI_12G4290 [Saccharomyces kudriavzevii IFO 1802]|uniref:FLD1-like protein n=2 Tax=Saccharomyces kudriavzevii (strain ATCC MYA-4449 / AS 2.2408 / CBS 8840 / NBRC 1802 / NCYC 2889) TaxID=226230 RepID=J6EG10_SACK1|nr:uncharacterized protein SKDI_12G4290 [Saccharomyces kudriavzevii IFO 1802]EJT42984.1 FLD1-like protein [Saccharomyces kudriavzevii IFO 1802]CAI4047051.1 hypothetical protein SKDI_12G4290 [Saccharomyces kudriavzevii IFO 1802]
MKINISRPLQLLQWSSYLVAVFLIQLLVILPLSVLIYHDFYLRLLPADSSNLVPLNTFNILNGIQFGTKFFQSIASIPVGTDLPQTTDNGLSQPIAMRDNIEYKLDLNLLFYCQNKNDHLNLDNLLIDIYRGPGPALGSPERVDSKDEKIFHTSRPIVCLTVADSISYQEIEQLGPSRLNVYNEEWLNTITIEDKISLDSSYETISMFLRTEMAQKNLIIQSESGITFRMNFEQGLRNLMLRKRFLSYIIGVSIFHFIICILFFIVGCTAFMFVKKSQKKSQKHS